MAESDDRKISNANKIEEMEGPDAGEMEDHTHVHGALIQVLCELLMLQRLWT